MIADDIAAGLPRHVPTVAAWRQHSRARITFIPFRPSSSSSDTTSTLPSLSLSLVPQAQMHPALRVAVRLAAARRCFTTAAHPIASSSVTSSATQTAAIPLSNVEAQWEKLSAEDQVVVHQQLEALQKKDWKELSIDEKKAGKFYLVCLCARAYRPGGVQWFFSFGSVRASSR